MPAKSKAQQKFMGMVHALQKGEIKPSDVSDKVKKVAKDMKKKDAEDFASTKHKGLPKKVKESTLNENPAAIAAAQRMVVQSKGKKVSVNTAKNSSYKEKDPSAHRKAKSMWQKIKDKFAKKEGVNEAQNELISISKDIKTYKGKKVPKGKYEVINARGKFATLMRIHDKVDGGNVYNLVPLNTLSKVASRLKESVNEDLDPYKDFGTDNSWEKEYDLNLGAFIDEYQKFIKAIKKIKPINDKNKRAWAHAIRKKVGKGMFNGYISMWMKPIEVLDRFKKFEKLPDKAGWVYESKESVNEDVYYGYYKNKKVKVNAKSDKDAKKQIISKLNIPKGDLKRASMINHTKNSPVAEAGMELNKIKDAIKMFQKKIDKQGRVTNARDEEHLKNLIKLYIQMGGKGIKESDLPTTTKKGKTVKVKHKKSQKSLIVVDKPAVIKKYAKLGFYPVNEDNIKFSKEEMAQLHKAGKIEKDGHTIEFSESVNEKIKLKSKSGMGTISHVGMPKASKGVEKIFNIADTGYAKVGGTVVDSMSANLFKQIYNKANDDIKKKLNKMNDKQLVNVILKMWDKFGKNVKL